MADMASFGRGPHPETKGRGFRGGSRPARHIPWPQIFKHHISVVEGHLKMLEMIKKHTIPETGNWRNICPMVDRSYEMLRMTKDAMRSFVSPSNLREQVLLGSSSFSMYPGYSPADQEYGKAAEEYGLAVAAARREGIGFKPSEDGLEYQTAQARGAKRTTLAGMRAAQAAREGGTRSGAGSGTNARSTSSRSALDGQAAGGKREDQAGNGENPYFFIDTNPTPVNLPEISHKPIKRSTEERSWADPVEQKKTKKGKTKHDGELPGSAATNDVETEDISEEVDARLKEKEERRRRKEEKKRKRLSDGSIGPVAEAPTTEVVAEKPKKKKAKKVDEAREGEASVGATKKRHTSENEAAEDGEGQKKKRKKTISKSEDI